MDSKTLSLPFFDETHKKEKARLTEWASRHLNHHSPDESRDFIDSECHKLVKSIGSAGFFKHCIGDEKPIDTRMICVMREELAFHHGLADFVFAMQGLGSGAISLFGTDQQKHDFLPFVARGEKIAAFALSEPFSGSDVANMTCSAKFDGQNYIINGEKTWISNGGIADFYLLIARTGEDKGARGLSAFIIDKNITGLEIAERIDVIAPHPLARLKFTNAVIPREKLIGERGQGFKIAMATLDVFRCSVAAAALGFARRALSESIKWAKQREMFGQTLADFQITQSKLAEMAAMLDAATLLTLKAAWLRDNGHSITREAAIAKMVATENAQKIIDSAVQMFGGRGVQKGNIIESLYREIRSLRIYEGATEVQQLIIGRDLIRE